MYGTHTLRHSDSEKINRQSRESNRAAISTLKLLVRNSSLKAPACFFSKLHNVTKYYLITSILLATLMGVAFLSTACQPTPEKEPITRREEEIWDAITSGEFKKLETPYYISHDYVQFQKLRVSFEAEVVVPNVTAYPVVEVTKKIFSDDDILDLIKLCSGKNNELFSEWRLSKDEWLQKLALVKMHEGTERVTEEWLDTLQNNYENSPEIIKNPLVSISDLPLGINSTVYVQADNNQISMYSVTRNSNFFVYYRDVFLDVYAASEFSDDQFDENFETKEHFLWRKPSDPGISQEEAYNKALEYVDELGVELDLYMAEPCSIILDQVNKSSGWMFTFTKSISGLQFPFQPGWVYLNPDALPSCGAPWSQEVFRIAINEEGVWMLWWNGASEISHTIAESAQLESFTTIKKRISDQLNYIYGTHDNGSGGLDFQITKIT